jgi:hypothetical protein
VNYAKGEIRVSENRTLGLRRCLRVGSVSLHPSLYPSTLIPEGLPHTGINEYNLETVDPNYLEIDILVYFV